MLIILLLCGLGEGYIEPPLCYYKNKTCPLDTLCRSYYDSTTGGLSTKCLKRGFCPETVSEWQMPGGRAQCQRLCEEDTECPGNQRCCTDLFGCGRQCRDPLPEYTCDNKKCEDGQSCVMNRSKCKGGVCLEPICVNATCNPPCDKDLKCEMDVHPSCTTGLCPLISRCLPKNPFCTPGCTEGYTCIFSQPPGCVSPPCPKVARCRPLCDPAPPGINTGACAVGDLCSPFPAPGQYGCTNGNVCCRTICGNLCIPPYRGP